MESSPAYLVAYYFAEWHSVRGGMGAVAQAILEKARKLGVKLMLNTRATRIKTRGNKVIGVEVNGHKEVDADVVLSTTSPLITFNIVDTNLKPNIEFPESRWVKHNVILKKYPRPPEPIEKYLGALISLEPVGAGEIVFPSILDQTLGGAVLNVMGPLEPLYQLFPDLKECVRRVDTLTPKRAEELYNLPKGNVNHLPMREPYLFDNRPGKGLAYRTPIVGLYIGGAGAYPGGQVSGVPGYNASEAIIEDLSQRKTQLGR
ncbi:MAG: FAD-dependent oxidoreductase [Thermoprotei archaeon]